MKPFIIVCTIIAVILILSITAYSQESLVLGLEENDGLLVHPFQAKEGPDGNIYVFDAKDAFIKVYSPRGTYLRRMAGRGQGPGEIACVGTFGFTRNDLLFFTEMIYGHRWITFMELSGKFHKVLKLDIPGQSGIYRAKILSENKILAEIHSLGSPEKRGNHYGFYYPRCLAIINAEGKITHIPLKKKEIFSVSYGPNGADIRVPFFPAFLWDTAKNEKIVFSNGAGNILQTYDLDGKNPGKINTPLPDAPEVSNADLNYWRESVKKRIVKKQGLEGYKRHFSMIEKYKNSIYKEKPYLSELSITPAGNFLFKGLRNTRDGKRYYWLIDKKGNMLSQIRSKASAITITPHFVLYIAENDEGDKVVYSSTRKGDEQEDLLAHCVSK